MDKPESVEKQIEDYLLICLFRGMDDRFGLSMNRAYLDFCRTLRITDREKAKTAREKSERLIRKETEALLDAGCNTQSQFDSWHCNLCKTLVEIYHPANAGFTLGQAQKWVNMTLKYLCVFKETKVLEIMEYLHVPIDRYIFDTVKRQFGIKPPCKAWSKMDSYDAYIKYQNDIRSHTGMTPLLWEFQAWNETINAK